MFRTALVLLCQPCIVPVQKGEQPKGMFDQPGRKHPLGITSGVQAMPNAGFNPKVDAYLGNAADFAKPIMTQVRALLHKTCPDVVEDIKWGIPHFDYKGEMMCIFAAHSRHCAFSFWKEAIMSNARLRENPALPATKRYLGRLTSVADLPPDDQLASLIREAMALNEKGVKLPPRASKRPQEIAMPEEFAVALARNAKAKGVFEAKSASFRKEYLTWITDAKTEATRLKRVDEAVAWIAEGKGRFWKYAKAG